MGQTVVVKEIEESHENEMAEEQKRLDGADDEDFLRELKKYVDAMLKTN
jgi:hypothetical protein